MSTPFLSELRWISFGFPPKGWAFANGQLLQINQNQTLFSLLGTQYGGDGRTLFALPNLQGRVPIHQGNGHAMGESAGAEAVTINMQQMPTHVHPLNATTQTADSQTGAGNVFGTVPGRLYSDPSNLTSLTPGTVSSVGGNQPHTNMMPYLALNCVIALAGIFPSQT